LASLDKIKTVINKILSINGLGEHICFFGGSIPYIYFNKESNREHSDIDILVEEEYMHVIRQLLKKSNIYKPELDSFNLNLDGDYGLKVYIDGVYVEFEPMIIKDGLFIRKSFSTNKKVAGIEQIPFSKIEDLIIKIDFDGTSSYCQSMEMIKVGKEQHQREKDLKDIIFIDEHGIDVEKYKRVKESLKMSSTNINSYEDSKEKKIS